MSDRAVELLEEISKDMKCMRADIDAIRDIADKVSIEVTK